MKKMFFLLVLFFLFGCVTIQMPESIKEEFAYKKSFNCDIDKSIKAVKKTLEDLGWKVADISRSKLIKEDRTSDNKPRYLAYIFTEIKQIQLFLTSSYSTFNVRLEALDETHTEIAIRYLSVMPIPPFYNKKISYKNDKLVDRIYANIEKYLSK